MSILIIIKRTDSVHKNAFNLNRSVFLVFQRWRKGGVWSLRRSHGPMTWYHMDKTRRFHVLYNTKWKWMTGCEVRRDGIIVPGAGANSNMHSSWLSTSLFSLVEQLHHQAHKTTVHFFFLANCISTESYMDPCINMPIFSPSPGTGNWEKTKNNKQVIEMNTR